VALLEHDPDLGEGLSSDQLALARREVRAEVVSYPAGTWEVDPEDFDGSDILGLLLIDGLMAGEVT
jgi:hypothetical protein